MQLGVSCKGKPKEMIAWMDHGELSLFHHDNLMCHFEQFFSETHPIRIKQVQRCSLFIEGRFFLKKTWTFKTFFKKPKVSNLKYYLLATGYRDFGWGGCSLLDSFLLYACIAHQAILLLLGTVDLPIKWFESLFLLFWVHKCYWLRGSRWKLCPVTVIY